MDRWLFTSRKLREAAEAALLLYRVPLEAMETDLNGDGDDDDMLEESAQSRYARRFWELLIKHQRCMHDCLRELTQLLVDMAAATSTSVSTTTSNHDDKNAEQNLLVDALGRELAVKRRAVDAVCAGRWQLLQAFVLRESILQSSPPVASASGSLSASVVASEMSLQTPPPAPLSHRACITAVLAVLEHQPYYAEYCQSLSSCS